MIIRGTPINKENYVLFSFEKGKEIHKLGVAPSYMDENGLWFDKDELKEKGGEFIGQ